MVGTQATPLRGPAPAGTPTGFQVAPPSAVDKITGPMAPSKPLKSKPSARHDDADTQLTRSSSVVAEGTTRGTQVVPPLVVVRISLATPPLTTPALPRAMHAVAVGQVTALSGPAADGTASGTQVAPPSVVEMAARC